MSEVRIKAETRTEFGKGAARRTRRAGQIPAVVAIAAPVRATVAGSVTWLLHGRCG